MSLKIAFFILIIPGCAGIPAQQMDKWRGKTKDFPATLVSGAESIALMSLDLKKK